MAFLFDPSNPWGWTVLKVLHILVLSIALLLFVAFLVLMDRKVWAAVQLRKGPNVVGAFGLLQPFADLLKFILKEVVIPAGANKPVFLLAPLVSFTLALAAWAVVPIAKGWVVSDINVGVLYIFAISSLGVYGIIMGGWASNSKYPFLGGLRSAAQMVSYEVSIGFVIITVILLVGSLNLSTIVMHQDGGFWHWHVWPLLPMFVVFYVSALAETNRSPFDLPDAESELVAGYQVEYSSSPYLLYMVAEYANVVLMCSMMTLLFFGGWLPPIPWGPLYAIPPVLWFLAKVIFFFWTFAMVKAFVPRFRYDQLMRLGWKVFLPTSLVYVLLVAAFLVFTGTVPPAGGA